MMEMITAVLAVLEAIPAIVTAGSLLVTFGASVYVAILKAKEGRMAEAFAVSITVRLPDAVELRVAPIEAQVVLKLSAWHRQTA